MTLERLDSGDRRGTVEVEKATFLAVSNRNSIQEREPVMGMKKTLGLFALVLGLIAIVASAAQAETGAKWTILKNDGTQTDAANLNATLEIKELEVSGGTFETKIAGTSVGFACNGAQLLGASLLGNGSITSGFKVKFTGCVTTLGGVFAAACLPLTGTTKDEIVTNPLKGLIVLHLLTPGGVLDTVVRIEPVTGEKLADLVLGSGECSIGEKVPILGKFAAKDGSALGTLATDHLAVEGVLTEMWAVSKTEEHRGKIVGSAWIRMSGNHAGLQWKGEPSGTPL